MLRNTLSSFAPRNKKHSKSIKEKHYVGILKEQSTEDLQCREGIDGSKDTN